MGKTPFSKKQLEELNNYAKRTNEEFKDIHVKSAFDKPFHFPDNQSNESLHKATKMTVHQAEISGNKQNALDSMNKSFDKQSQEDESLLKASIQVNNDLNEIANNLLCNPLIFPLIPQTLTAPFDRIAYFFHAIFVNPPIYKFEDIYYMDANGSPFIIYKESIKQWNPLIRYLNEYGVIQVRSIQCASSEKEALLRLILSTSSPFRIPIYTNTMSISYGSVIDAIHSNIIDYVTDEVHIYANANGNPIKTAKDLSATRLKWANLIYSQSHYNYNFAKHIQARIIDKCDDALNNMPDSDQYSSLHEILRELCAYSIPILNQFAILFAKIYCGREFLKHSSMSQKNATIIISRNPHFIYNLFSHIIKGVHITTPMALGFGLQSPDYAPCILTDHNSNWLSESKNIIHLIYDKANGNIVNIDDSKQTTINQQLKDILSGKSVKINDDVVGKMSYRSNAHFIFLRESDDQKLSKELEAFADVIDLSKSPFDGYVYSGDICLDEYEIYFFAIGLVKYGIDLLLEGKENVAIPTKELDFRNFVQKYIKRIDTPKDSTDKERFTHNDILYSYYSDYQKLLNNPMYSKETFRDKIRELFPNIDYRKVNSTIDGKRKDAMAFIGLEFNKYQFEIDLKELQNNPPMEMNTRKDFSNFLSKLINDYHKYISSQMENISSNINQ